MFSRKISALLSWCDPAALTLPGPGVRAAQVETRAQAAMSHAPGSMSMSQRIHNPREWTRMQRQRRDDLEALLAADAAPERTERILDLVCEICEEADWADISAGPPLQDIAHPAIDRQCAETACLMGWTALLLASRPDSIAPHMIMRMLHETRRRVFTPILSHEDYSFMAPETPGAISVLCAAATAGILLETDISRRNAVLRRLTRLLDDACDAMDASARPLEALVSDARAATDLAEIMRRVSRGAVNLSDQLPMGVWLDTILAAHAGGAMFFDPAGNGMLPQISGADVYRLGVSANDDALRALGAALDRLTGIPASSVNGRLLFMDLALEMSGEMRRSPKLRHARVPGLAIGMGGGFLCALYGSGSRGNIGDMAIMLEDRPLFVDAGADVSSRNLPMIAGNLPLAAPRCPDLECDFSRERAMLSLDLTDTYPSDANIRVYQRTLLIDREQDCVRLIDTLDLPEGGVVRFQFITAQHPQLSRDGMGLGATWFSWPGEPQLRINSISSRDFPGDLWLVSLEYMQRSGREIYAFELERT